MLWSLIWSSHPINSRNPSSLSTYSILSRIISFSYAWISKRYKWPALKEEKRKHSSASVLSNRSPIPDLESLWFSVCPRAVTARLMILHTLQVQINICIRYSRSRDSVSCHILRYPSMISSGVKSSVWIWCKRAGRRSANEIRVLRTLHDQYRILMLCSHVQESTGLRSAALKWYIARSIQWLLTSAALSWGHQYERRRHVLARSASENASLFSKISSRYAFWILCQWGILGMLVS